MKTLKILVGFAAFIFFAYFLPARLAFFKIGPNLAFPGSQQLAIISLLVGLFFIGWTTSLFFLVGKGTPLPSAPPKKLVVSGPYRYTRNPMSLGLFSVLLGEALLWESMEILIYLIGLIIFSHLVIIPKEEKDLANRFGYDYIDYLRRVPRWLPKF